MLKFFLALVAALTGMLAFRALVVTICTVDGQGLEPVLLAGDRVMVNRWSYGLRTGSDDGLFGYGRLLRQDVERGDLVAFEDPSDSISHRVMICQCVALPGDTLRSEGRTVVVPSLRSCADADYYWMQSVGPNQHDSRTFGFVSEKRIIGRVFLVVYSSSPHASFFDGWRQDRLLLLR